MSELLLIAGQNDSFDDNFISFNKGVNDITTTFRG